MTQVDLLIVGAGPAGLCAALEAGAAGADVLLLDRGHAPGGQLVKQTHMFFGSEKQHASVRGFEIADILLAQIKSFPNVEIKLNATVLAAYDNGVWTAEIDGRYTKIKPRAVIMATGASEKSMLFPGNDLPGIFGAGAVQTLMNQYGVKPADRVLMVGWGNIGLIVSYQLLQAGVDVLAVLGRSGKIGGYLVHASKLRRMGVPILARHSVKSAQGTDRLETVTVWKLDKHARGIPGTEKTYEVDALCISVGLSPLSELLWQAGCDMLYSPALGGYVARRDENMQTSVPNIFIAGDVAGIEEASSAMVEGQLAGISAARHLGFTVPDADAKTEDCFSQLASLRHGPGGERFIAGIESASVGQRAEDRGQKKPRPAAPLPPPSILQGTGVPDEKNINSAFPEEERLQKGPVAVIECYEKIPCNPCVMACNRGAIREMDDINDIPVLDNEKCNGCALCLAKCPGLAIMVVDMTWSEERALIKIPYEFRPLPKKGETVVALDRAGEPAGTAEVVQVMLGKATNKVPIVSVAVDKELAKTVRNIKPQPLSECGDDCIVCRCSDLSLDDIRRLMDEGYTSVEEMKRIARLGMGACQGRNCIPLVLGEISNALDKPISALSPGTYRPTVKAIKLGELAKSDE